MEQFIIQFAGLIAFVFTILIFQAKNRATMLHLTIYTALFWGLHFGLLSAWTAAAMSIMSLFRSFIFVHNDKKWGQSRWWLHIFIILYLAIGIVTWQGWVSVFPVISEISATVAFWMKNTAKIRLLALISPPCWIIYGLLIGSYTLIFTEGIVLISIILAILRLDAKSESRFIIYITHIHLPHFGLHHLQLRRHKNV